MTKLRDEIPQRAFINAQIIQEVSKTAAFKEAQRSVLSRHGIDSYDFLNQAYIASLLYCLLVVPREIWLDDSRAEIYEELKNKRPADNFSNVRIDSQKFTPVFNLIRHLRNSISHARYSIDDNLNFHFWDQNCRNSLVVFEARASRDNLMRFISDIGSFLANIRNRK